MDRTVIRPRLCGGVAGAYAAVGIEHRGDVSPEVLAQSLLQRAEAEQMWRDALWALVAGWGVTG